jgi:phosphonate transport system ATP-binding protein
MIKIENLNHTYANKSERSLKNINLHIKKGESVVILGSSGSGKSTLFKAINRLIEPASGKVYIADKDILNIHPKNATPLRGKIGMIFQQFNLVERESVLKNTLNGRLRYNSTFNTLIGKFSKEDHTIALECLKMVGLEGYEHERACNLSGGQKQRVAIARTLAQKPDIILADEPISSLDPKLMKEILDILKDVCIEKQITLITSLHFFDFAKKYGSRIIGIKDGEIVFDGKPKELTEKNVIKIYGETGF